MEKKILAIHLDKLSTTTRIIISIFLFVIITIGYFYFLLEWKNNSPIKFFGRHPFFWFFSAIIITYFIVGIHLIRKYKKAYIKCRIAFLVFYQFVCFYIIGQVLSKFDISSLFMPWPTNFAAFRVPSKTVVIYHVVFAFIIVPFLVYRYGRGAVCSWFCNYAVRSELFADCFRDRAPRSILSIRLESLRYIPFGFVVIVTILFIFNKNPQIGLLTLSSWYALIFMGFFNSIIGQSLFPLFGGRLSCRYICALGTYVRLLASFSHFKIKANKDKCKKCGLCTRYCQMGIDVMGYVIKGEDVSTERCVGCGICVEKCPYGALEIFFRDPKYRSNVQSQ